VNEAELFADGFCGVRVGAAIFRVSGCLSLSVPLLRCYSKGVAAGEGAQMPLRISHKLSTLVDFPRLVLRELAAIRQAQDNFFRLSLQNQDAQSNLITTIKRQIEDHTSKIEATLHELKQNSLEPNQIGTSDPN
jgi:hypothetical protein